MAENTQHSASFGWEHAPRVPFSDRPSVRKPFSFLFSFSRQNEGVDQPCGGNRRLKNCPRENKYVVNWIGKNCRLKYFFRKHVTVFPRIGRTKGRTGLSCHGHKKLFSRHCSPPVHPRRIALCSSLLHQKKSVVFHDELGEPYLMLIYNLSIFVFVFFFFSRPSQCVLNSHTYRPRR